MKKLLILLALFSFSVATPRPWTFPEVWLLNEPKKALTKIHNGFRNSQEFHMRADQSDLTLNASLAEKMFIRFKCTGQISKEQKLLKFRYLEAGLIFLWKAIKLGLSEENAKKMLGRYFDNPNEIYAALAGSQTIQDIKPILEPFKNKLIDPHFITVSGKLVPKLDFRGFAPPHDQKPDEAPHEPGNEDEYPEDSSSEEDEEEGFNPQQGYPSDCQSPHTPTTSCPTEADTSSPAESSLGPASSTSSSATATTPDLETPRAPSRCSRSLKADAVQHDVFQGCEVCRTMKGHPSAWNVWHFHNNGHPGVIFIH